MLVLRIEHIENGRGYYNSGYSNSPIHTNERSNQCPGPSCDGLGGGRYKYKHIAQSIFGFESMESLTNWFILEKLQESRNFKLSIYRVHKRHVRFGTKQITFRKDKAKLECWIHLTQQLVEIDN